MAPFKTNLESALRDKTIKAIKNLFKYEAINKKKQKLNH